MPGTSDQLYIQTLAKGRLHLAYVLMVGAVVLIVALVGLWSGRISAIAPSSPATTSAASPTPTPTP